MVQAVGYYLLLIGYYLFGITESEFDIQKLSDLHRNKYFLIAYMYISHAVIVLLF